MGMLSEAGRNQAISEARTAIRESFDYLTKYPDDSRNVRLKSIKKFNKHYLSLIQGLGLTSFEAISLIDLTPVDTEKPISVPEIISEIYKDYDFLVTNPDADLVEKRQTTFRFNQGFLGLIRGSGMTPFQVIAFMRIEMHNQNLLQSTPPK
ncbi:MAG: hypothetical protein ABH812_00990 [bacterium]